VTLTGGLAAFAIDGCVVGVRTPDAPTAQMITRLIPYYAVDGTRDDVEFLHELDTSDNNWILTEPGGERTLFASLGEVYDALEYLVSIALLRCMDGFVHLHAAGAATERAAVLALGQSGAGKSTLALRWSLSGLRVFGDDTVLLDDAGQVHPFRRLFDVHRDRLAEYDCPIDSDLPELTDEDEVWFDPAAGSGWAEPSKIARIAVVRYQSGVPLSIVPMRKPQMLAAISASVMPTGLTASNAFDRLVDICATAETLEVTFGDSREAATALASLA
jgi:hypothetical protein